MREERRMQGVEQAEGESLHGACASAEVEAEEEQVARWEVAGGTSRPDVRIPSIILRDTEVGESGGPS